MSLSIECLVDGFGRSVADRACCGRGTDACCASAFEACSVSGFVDSCCAICVGVGSSGVGKFIVVLLFGAEALATSGNVGSLMTMPVGETTDAS